MDTQGYGRVSLNDQDTRAHRVAFLFAFGPIPDGLFVLHRCDNPPCCNPAHLYLGTNAENMRDRSARGRNPALLQSKDTCNRGHLMSPDNVIWRPKRGRPNGERRCRACSRAYRAVHQREWDARYLAKRRAQRAISRTAGGGTPPAELVIPPAGSAGDLGGGEPA